MKNIEEKSLYADIIALNQGNLNDKQKIKIIRNIFEPKDELEDMTIFDIFLHDDDIDFDTKIATVKNIFTPMILNDKLLLSQINSSKSVSIINSISKPIRNGDGLSCLDILLSRDNGLDYVDKSLFIKNIFTPKDSYGTSIATNFLKKAYIEPDNIQTFIKNILMPRDDLNNQSYIDIFLQDHNIDNNDKLCVVKQLMSIERTDMSLINTCLYNDSIPDENKAKFILNISTPKQCLGEQTLLDQYLQNGINMIDKVYFIDNMTKPRVGLEGQTLLDECLRDGDDIDLKNQTALIKSLTTAITDNLGIQTLLIYIKFPDSLRFMDSMFTPRIALENESLLTNMSTQNQKEFINDIAAPRIHLHNKSLLYMYLQNNDISFENKLTLINTISTPMAELGEKRLLDICILDNDNIDQENKQLIMTSIDNILQEYNQLSIKENHDNQQNQEENKHELNTEERIEQKESETHQQPRGIDGFKKIGINGGMKGTEAHDGRNNSERDDRSRND